MYYLVDLFENTKKEFDTKCAVLSYWRWRVIGRRFNYPSKITRLTFNELNITGKDMGLIYTFCPGHRDPETGFFITSGYTCSIGLRRYQVLDSDGHPCDIRTWKDEIRLVEKETFPSWIPACKTAPGPRFRVDPIPYSGGYPMRNRSCGSFTLQRLKDIKNKPDFDFENDFLGFTPIRDHSKVRTPDMSYRKWKSRPIHSWKTQSKNRSQWGRHQKRSPENSQKEYLAWVQAEEEKLVEEAAKMQYEEELEMANEVLADDYFLFVEDEFYPQ